MEGDGGDDMVEYTGFASFSFLNLLIELDLVFVSELSWTAQDDAPRLCMLWPGGAVEGGG
jgi:hypothetical protein